MSSPLIRRSQRRSRLNGCVWLTVPGCIIYIFYTTHITKNFDQNNFRSLTVATKPAQHYHWQKDLPFLLSELQLIAVPKVSEWATLIWINKVLSLALSLSSWQHFLWIFPLSQWLYRKSTAWFLSRRMRRHFSPVKFFLEAVTVRIAKFFQIWSTVAGYGELCVCF